MALYDLSGTQLGQPSGRALPSVSNCVSPEAENDQLRLVENSCPADLTTSPLAGRVEVTVPYDNFTRWGTVCDDPPWNDLAAKVICRSLGASGGTAYYDAACGESDDPIWLTDIECSGDEDFLEDCDFNTMENNCLHTEDAAVSCEVPEFGADRLLAAECPNINNGMLPFVTCAGEDGLYAYNELAISAFTDSNAELGGSERILNIPPGQDLQGWFYTRTGHLLALGTIRSSLLKEENGEWAVQQTTSDILGRFPMVDIGNTLYALQQDTDPESMILQRFEISNNTLVRDSENFEHITLKNPGRMIAYRNTILISEQFQEEGISRFRILLRTSENSQIPGLSDLATTTMADDEEETTQSQNSGSTLHLTLWGIITNALLIQQLAQ